MARVSQKQYIATILRRASECFSRDTMYYIAGLRPVYTTAVSITLLSHYINIYVYSHNMYILFFRQYILKLWTEYTKSEF